MKTSEFYPYTWRTWVGDVIMAMIFPFVRIKYGGFWALRMAALNHHGIRGAILRRCYRHYCSLFGASIPLAVRMDGPPLFPHGLNGIFIGELTHLGRNVTILQQVTIGQDTFAPLEDNARRNIGDDVFIGAGAKIIGGVVIGDHCRIGANACVYADMEPHSVAVMAPTRVIQKSALDNEFRADGRVWRDGEWIDLKKEPSK